MSASPTCPLCLDSRPRFLHRSDDRHGVREFYECATCDLAFVPPRFHLPIAAEIDRYLLHDNDPADVRYRQFLDRLWSVLQPQLPEGSSGLDYGCGPGPALAQMIREDGFDVEKYDLHFFPDTSALDRSYHFITCTETIEHLRTPRDTLRLIDRALRLGGKLGIMTGMLDDRSTFPAWGYQRDPTHIAFYTRATMRWIGQWMGWRAEFPAPNVTIFTKHR